MLNNQALVQIPMHLEDLPLDIAAEALTNDIDRVRAGGKFLVEGMLALSTLQQQLQQQLQHSRQADENAESRSSAIVSTSPRDSPTIAPPEQTVEVAPSSPVVQTSGRVSLPPVEEIPPTPDQDTRPSIPESSASEQRDVLDLRIPELELPSRQASSAGPSSEPPTTLRLFDEIDTSQQSDQSGSHPTLLSSRGSSLTSQSEPSVAGGKVAAGNRDFSEKEEEDAKASGQTKINAAMDRVRAMEVRVLTATRAGPHRSPARDTS